ncbi:ABC transporter ATP-binding protein [Dubosiella newyorkensis]|jgi:ABC-2 type transport system ATP-binding protein|uniref:ABC transporter ATP-binding protein n=3 Tax=Dubosiella newyorkensis TaxID=1862672 RepID=UPI002357F907|nr:ABC transporter ATP-binding protein [Dubosiella newyorkensis]MCI9041451.1 ABC transporter ATP-binding protein [Dubosiella newyorkensis]
MTSALQVHHLTKKYPTFTLQDLSFDLPQGTIIGLIGENGAGKSTLIRCLLQMSKPDQGEIEPPIKDFNQLSYIPDSCVFPEILTIEQFEQDFASIYKHWESAKFWDMVKRFKLPHKQKLKTFSKGMKVKLAFCVAFSHHAKLLILDEATFGLDPLIRDEILDLLLEFIQKEDHTVLFSTHITSDLEKVADYILYIHEGKKMFMDTKDDLMEKYVIMHCTQDEYQKLPSSKIVRVIKQPYQMDVLVEKKEAEYTFDTPTLEDLMRMYSKGEKR